MAASGRRLPLVRSLPASALEKLLQMDNAKSEVGEFFLPKPGNFQKADAQIRETSGDKRLSAQPVDATHALNRSAGVSKPSVLRGRSFN